MDMIEPNERIKDITNINAEELKEKGILGIILDVDKTIAQNHELKKGAEKWLIDLATNGIAISIVSNNIREHKDIVGLVNDLNRTKLYKNLLTYQYFACKPFNKRSILKTAQKMKLEPKNIAIIGDNSYTDILVGNRCGLYTIKIDENSNKVKRKDKEGR